MQNKIDVYIKTVIKLESEGEIGRVIKNKTLNKCFFFSFQNETDVYFYLKQNKYRSVDCKLCTKDN